MWYLCKTFKVKPDDPFITEMDSVQRSWMFNSWVEDKRESYDFYKNHAYLIGGFSNPDMLNKIINDNASTFESDDVGYEKSLEIVKQSNEDMENKASLKKRKRRKKIGN